MVSRNVIVGAVGAALVLIGILIIIWPIPRIAVSPAVAGVVVLDDAEAVAAMRDSGFTEEQIAAVTLLLRAYDDALTAALEHERGNRLNALESRLTTRIATSQTESTRWGIGASIAIGGLIVGIVGRKQ